MFKKIRIGIITILIEINEKFVFNRKLLRFYKEANRNKKISCFIDVGANLGQTIDLVLMINKNCSIYAFEPNPELFNKLRKKYNGNKNIQLFQLGVSNIDGEKIFYENLMHSTSSFEKLNYDSKYLAKKSKILGANVNEIIKKTYSVNVISLSKFILEQVKESNIDFIKIDTEGHEYACLQGLFNNNINKNINYIQLENHCDDMYLKTSAVNDILNILTQNKFKLNTKLKHGFGGIEELLFMKDLNTL